MAFISHNPTVLTEPKDNSSVVLVPLSSGKGYAKINEEDFLRIREEGYTGKWFLNSDRVGGIEYVRTFHKTNNKSVSRLILNPPPGYVVRYRNTDRTDLRRCNLVLCTRKELKAANLGASDV